MKAISYLLFNKHSYFSLKFIFKKSDNIQTDWYLIFNLSVPSGKSVNDDISKRYDAITYESFVYTIKLIQEYDKRCKMIKRDLKSAFRHIFIAASDYWLLILEWEGQYYIDICLSFKLCIISWIFNLFIEVIYWIFIFLYKWFLFHYLDDFFIIFSLNINLAEKFA